MLICDICKEPIINRKDSVRGDFFGFKIENADDICLNCVDKIKIFQEEQVKIIFNKTIEYIKELSK